MSETVRMLPDDEALWRRLATRLNKYGLISDEDEPWLTQTGIRDHQQAIEKKVRALGYSGGDLSLHAFSSQEEGWLTLVYDTSRFEAPREAERAWEDMSEAHWKDSIAKQADNWIYRLTELRSKIREWVRDTSNLSLVLADRPPVQMLEELMIRYSVTSREMPSFDIRRGNRAVLRFQPKGLWIIGGNGRVDLIAATSSYILIDMSQTLADVTDWQVYGTEQRQSVGPLTREFLVTLISDHEEA